jgi:hypothetical protein
MKSLVSSTLVPFIIALSIGAATVSHGAAAVLAGVPKVAVSSEGKVALLRSESGNLSVGDVHGVKPVWRVPFEYRAVDLVAVGSWFGVFCTSKKADEPMLWLVNDDGKVKQRVDLRAAGLNERLTAVGAADEGSIVVVGTIRGSVVRLDAKSNFKATSPLPFLSTTGRIGVVAVAAGAVAVSDEEGSSVLLSTSAGSPRRLPIGDKFVSGMAFSLDGRSLYVVTGYTPSVMQIDVNTGMLNRFTLSKPAAHVAVAKDGSLWLVDSMGTEMTHVNRSGRVIGSTRLTQQTFPNYKE